MSPPDREADVPAEVRAREERALVGEVGRLEAEWRALDAQVRQRRAERDRPIASLEAQRRLVATHDLRVGMRSELVDRAAGSRAQLLDAEEARQVQIVALVTMEGQLVEARAAIEVIESSKARTVAAFVADQTQKLGDAERTIDDLRERREKARARVEHSVVTAPMAGTVTALAINGIGQVVGAGEEVLRIVPDGERLELEVHVSNADIGFIRRGQAVTVKIDAFPFTRFGSIAGTVDRIARDAVADPDVQQAMASLRSLGAGGTRHAQRLVFPVVVDLDRRRRWRCPAGSGDDRRRRDQDRVAADPRIPPDPARRGLLAGLHRALIPSARSSDPFGTSCAKASPNGRRPVRP
jgi:hemolysin D